jgi:predicted alpha/beta-hydrolase family hydrolase
VYLFIMKPLQLKFKVGDSAGEVSGELLASDACKVILALAHGAGAPMTQPFLVKLSYALHDEGIATIRYNFPYMEQKKKRPDFPVIAHQTVKAAADKALELRPDLPLVLAGKSFGGRMSSQLMAKERQPNVKAIVFYGFPLHPAGTPGTERAEHLRSVSTPMLFMQGSRDALAELSLIKQVISTLPTSTLEVFEGADHSFKAGKKDFIVDLSKKTKDWLIATEIFKA